MKVKDKEQRYQWKKGERFGEIVTVERKDSEFTYFTDGTKVYTNVLSEFLESFIGDNPPFPSTEQNNPVIVKQENTNVSNIEVESGTDSTLKNLIQRLSKNNNIDLNLNVGIKIPKKEFIDLFESNDELDDIINAITREALSEIEINKLQLILKSQITSLIKNYYGITA